MSCTGTNSSHLKCGNIAYMLFISPNYVTINTIVKAGETYKFHIYAEYQGNTLIDAPITQTGMGFTLVWSQN